MDIERLATSAVIKELSKTERLQGFINDGDKEPCWDGNIYIHEDSHKTKKNIKKVPTQVKGKLVKDIQAKETIEYSISYDNLHAYMMDGGTLFFVVYLDKNTGDTIQIYFSDLLPIKIKEILKSEKSKYKVEFKRFPSENLKKTELLINFYMDMQRQTSFAGKDYPSIAELQKKGVLESLSVHYTSLENYDTESAFPKMIDGQSLTVYANIRGGVAPIPVEYHTGISHVFMFRFNPLPITVNGKIFYNGYRISINSDQIEMQIGSSVKMTRPNTGRIHDHSPFQINIGIKGSLSERIKSMEFVSSLIDHGSFCIGSVEIPIKLTEKEIEVLNIPSYPEVLENYKKIKMLLERLNVRKDLSIQDCTGEDYKKINLLIATICKKMCLKECPDKTKNFQIMKIANLTLAVVYLENQNGGYDLVDYFGNHLKYIWTDDNNTEYRLSQFSSMVADDFLKYDNLNLQMIIDDHKMIPESKKLFDVGNLTMLEILKAYDKKPSPDLLEAAKQMLAWQIDHPQFTNIDVNTINKMQITFRERKLSFCEKAELNRIAVDTEDDFIKLGSLLLLEEQEEAHIVFDGLTPQRKDEFRAFPIFKFYKTQEDNADG